MSLLPWNERSRLGVGTKLWDLFGAFGQLTPSLFFFWLGPILPNVVGIKISTWFKLLNGSSFPVGHGGSGVSSCRVVSLTPSLSPTTHLTSYCGIFGMPCSGVGDFSLTCQLSDGYKRWHNAQKREKFPNWTFVTQTLRFELKFLFSKTNCQLKLETFSSTFASILLRFSLLQLTWASLFVDSEFSQFCYVWVTHDRGGKSFCRKPLVVNHIVFSSVFP